MKYFSHSGLACVVRVYCMARARISSTSFSIPMGVLRNS